MLIMLAESWSLRRKLVRHPADAGQVMRWLIQWGSMFGLICTLAQNDGTWQGHIDKILAEANYIECKRVFFTGINFWNHKGPFQGSFYGTRPSCCWRVRRKKSNRFSKC